MKQQQELSERDLIIRDIDELQKAIGNLSNFPFATHALLAALEERYNAYDLEIRKIAENHESRR